MGSASISFPILGENFVIYAPRSISVFGFQLYLYGLFITAGFILAGVYLYIRRDTFKLTQDNVLDLIIMAVPCGLLGARIYYIIFNADLYFGPGKWQNIINFREGGLAVYGGVLGGMAAFYIYSRRKKIPPGKLLDAAGFGLFIGQSLGRWGNFFNREAYGTATSLPWRMGLTTYAGTIFVHPTFLYESLWNFIGLILMHIFSKKRGSQYYGQYFLMYVAWYGFGRFFIEGIRIDSLYIYGTNIRVSQLLAALSCIAAFIILRRNHIRGYTSNEDVESTSPQLAEGTDSEDLSDDEADDVNGDMDDKTSENIEYFDDQETNENGQLDDEEQEDDLSIYTDE